ncbi:MAG TPA: DUF1569 domain-containing protein [Pyrinomonadaceae bacterium]|nr:DUF1569 domain-containing protein [Pyrinomonadaceae bacterium]
MNLFDQQKREAIIARINNLTPEAKGLWGKMNVNQMICHCTDGLRGSLGELDGKTDESNFLSRSLIKFLVLYVMPIPKDVPTSKRVDQMQDGTKPTDFESDRKTLLEFIEKMTSKPNDFAWSSHFKFGAMNRKEWGILSYKHIDHHLKQFGV